MADKALGGLTSATLPLDDADQMYIVQSGSSRATAVADIISKAQSLYTTETTHVDAATLYANSTDRHISALDTSIETVEDNTRVLVLVGMSCETTFNAMFYLKRDGVEVGSPAPAGSRRLGLTPSPYDNNLESTMAQVSMMYVDTVPLASTNVVYSVHVRSTNTSFSLNRTVADGNSEGYERGTSTVVLQTIGTA